MLRVKKRKFKNHKGLLKRIKVRKNQVLMKVTGTNKYAAKKSNRNVSARRATKLKVVPNHYLRMIRKMYNFK